MGRWRILYLDRDSPVQTEAQGCSPALGQTGHHILVLFLSLVLLLSWSPSYPWSTSYPGPPPIPVPPLLSNPGGISAPFPGAHPSTAMEGLTGIDVSPAGVERGRGRGGESPGFHPFSRCRLLVGRGSRGGCGIVLLVPLALRAGRFAVHGELHRKGQMEREI